MSVPKSYALSVCNQFAQLGARGITFLCASGDSGVGNTGSCISNDGKNTSAFIPAFPASCPYVTSVGGTKNVEPEVAALNPDNNYSSGGGFSNYFPRPGYQDAVVPAYIASLGAQYRGQYNPAGRGYPDISAQGQHFATIWFGDIQILDGTSAACPTAAGVLALVNDVLIAGGRPPLGFLNPCLYERLHAAFTDVTSGSAVGGGVRGGAGGGGGGRGGGGVAGEGGLGSCYGVWDAGEFFSFSSVVSGGEWLANVRDSISRM